MLVPKAVSLASGLKVLSTVALTASLPIHDPLPVTTISLLESHSPVLPTNRSFLNPLPLKFVSPPFPPCLLPSARTCPAEIPPSVIPLDPLFYRIRDTSVSICLHDYGSRLSIKSTYRTLEYAVQDVMDHVLAEPSGGETPMTRQFPGYVYQADHVRLQVQSLLEPTPAMTWGMWGDALQGLRLFGERWEFVVVKFDIWEDFDKEGEKPVGIGHLWLVG